MAAQEATVFIDRPVTEVFAYMNDVSREREWQPQLIEAEQIPPGPAAVGTRRRYASEFMGKRLENTYVIRAYEENRRLVLESTKDSALDATTEIRWAAEGPGTRVTMSIDGRPSGMLRFVPRAVLEKTFSREVTDALTRVKEILE